ncbi:MAG TPA: hypothetical protein VGQ83_38515 [Polyangia bacterium]|jgi:hypothetical protein
MSTPSRPVATGITAVDNRIVWDRQPGRYEVWFVTCNHRASETGFWIRHTLSAPAAGQGEPVCQLWFARFDGRHPAETFAINRKLPITDLTAADEPFEIRVGEASLREDGLRGAIEGDGHRAEWDLQFVPASRSVLTLPRLAYRTARTDTKFLSPNFSVPLRGRLVADGREYVFDHDRATQCHIWGKKHAHAWAWGHVCGFVEDEGVGLDVLSVTLKKGPVVLPRLTVATLRDGGEDERLTQPWHLPFGHGEWYGGAFYFRAGSATVQIEGSFTASPADMVVAQYTDPDGEPAYCHNTEIATARLVVRRRTLLSLSRWREAMSLTAPRLGHFEYASRTPDPAVARRHTTI